MKKNVLFLLSIFFLLQSCSNGYETPPTNQTPTSKNSDEVVWNVKSKYGDITASHLQKAINDAVLYRKQNPDSTIVLLLDKGRYTLDTQVDVPKTNEDGTGWLILRGSGSENATTGTELVDTDYANDTNTTFNFFASYRVKLEHFRMAGAELGQSQGTIVSANSDEQSVTIKIDEGYPEINQMYQVEDLKANKIRLFDDSGSDGVAHFVLGPSEDPNASQGYYRIGFKGTESGTTAPVSLGNRTWKLFLKDSELVLAQPNSIGKRVGISSKSNRGQWASMGKGGADFIIDDLALLRLGRCTFKGDWNNITISNFRIERPMVNGKYAFYSTEAGPQIGNISGITTNVIMKNCDIRGTVDDSTAFYFVQSGLVTNNHWEDGGGVNVGNGTNSEKLIFQNNTHINNPLQFNP